MLGVWWARLDDGGEEDGGTDTVNWTEKNMVNIGLVKSIGQRNYENELTIFRVQSDPS
jgi:hypothetical protein